MKKIISLNLILLALGLVGCNNGSESDVIEGSGTIETTTILLSSKTAGTVEQIYYDEGAKIEKGDTLLIIDHELSDIQLKQAKAGEKAARAQLNLLMKGARKEDILQAEAGLIQAQASYNSAKTDKERFAKLLSSNAITQKQYDDANTRFDIAEAKLKAAKEKVKKVKNIARKEEIDQANANLSNAEARVLLAEKNIRDSRVISPISGFIVQRFVEKGENVMPAASLFKIADLSIADIVIYVPEEKLGKLKLGQSGQITTDTYGDKVYTGKVIYISPEAEFTPKSIQTKDERTKLVFAVKIRVPNENFELKSGMPADAKIQL